MAACVRRARIRLFAAERPNRPTEKGQSGYAIFRYINGFFFQLQSEANFEQPASRTAKETLNPAVHRRNSTCFSSAFMLRDPSSASTHSISQCMRNYVAVLCALALLPPESRQGIREQASGKLNCCSLSLFRCQPRRGLLPCLPL